MEGKDELLEVIAVASVMAEENPCGLDGFVMGSLAKGMSALLSQKYTKAMTQEAVAKYLGVSVRTLQRYSKEYKDFPAGRHDGHKELSYDAVSIVKWKRSHPTLFT